MADKRKRGQNFTIDEKDRLIKVLLEHKQTILNKKTDGATNEAKHKAWNSVTETFNTMGQIYRSKDSLMKMWEKLKSESKIYYTASRRDTTQTGGGPSVIKIDPILEQVCAILGRGCTGIIGVADSDSTGTEKQNFPKVLCLSNESASIDMINLPVITNFDCQDIESNQNIEKEVAAEEFVNTTPLWSRRRPQQSQNNERTEAMSTLCNSYTDVNKKKENTEDLKHTLLVEELEFKRKLYQLQLLSAEKEIEIKNEVLGLIKSK